MTDEGTTIATEAEARALLDPDRGRLETQLIELREQTEQMRRELDGLRNVLQEQQLGSAELHGALATVEGRTRRHEAGQEIARFVQQQLGAVTERIEEESALRRDQRGALEREQQRGRELAESGAAALGELAERLRSLEQRSAGDAQRHRQLTDEVAALHRAEERTDERIAGAEGRLAALVSAWAEEREERGRFDAALPELATALDGLDARTVALRAELRRSEDELALVRARRDREDELVELVEQQRSTRLRLEERLGALEARLEETVQGFGGATEERLGLARQLAGLEERLSALTDSLEAQRWAVIEHFQRLVDVEQAGSRKQIEELERRIREGRRLVVRLREGSEHASEEQPL